MSVAAKLQVTLLTRFGCFRSFPLRVAIILGAFLRGLADKETRKAAGQKARKKNCVRKGHTPAGMHLIRIMAGRLTQKLGGLEPKSGILRLSERPNGVIINFKLAHTHFVAGRFRNRFQIGDARRENRAPGGENNAGRFQNGSLLKMNCAIVPGDNIFHSFSAMN